MYSKQGSTCIWDCLLNIRSGKESCENSKAMRENLLENVFVDAFHITPMFRFKMLSNQLIIILDTVKLEKHYIYYLVDLLSKIELKR